MLQHMHMQHMHADSEVGCCCHSHFQRASVSLAMSKMSLTYMFVDITPVCTYGQGVTDHFLREIPYDMI